MTIMPKRLRHAHIWLVTLGTVLLSIPFHMRPDNFIVDDGYFYPQIARHIAQGHGSTFNGITLTNGYHPLWMFVSVLASSVTLSSAALVQILGAVQDLFMLGSLLIIVLAARRAGLRGALLGILPLLFIGMTLGIWRLLECYLALALQTCVLAVALPLFPEWSQEIKRFRTPLLGILLGLTMLARLDLLFFSTVILLSGLFLGPRSTPLLQRLQAMVVQGCIAALVVTPYLVWNWHQFHHLLPVSGAIKSTFPHANHWRFPDFTYGPVAGIFLNSLLAVRSNKTSFEWAALLSAVAAALHMAFTLSFGEIAPWYLTTGYLTLAFAITWICDLILRRSLRLGWLEPVLCLFLLACLFALGSLRIFSNFTYTRYLQGTISFSRSYAEPKHVFADKLKAALPPGTRIFAFDAIGGTAFYSGMNLLPADGLVSDYAYSDDVTRQGFAEYARKHEIKYFVAPILHKDQGYARLFLFGRGLGSSEIMQVEAPLTHKSAGTVLLNNDSIVVRSSQVNPELETIMPEVAAWRITP